MKNFKNVFRTLSSNKSVTCAYHNESKLPFLRPLEYCIKCQLSICYHCGNKHIDNKCNVECTFLFISGGTEIFEDYPNPLNMKNERFNQGYPYLLDLKKLKCPCGTPFLSKETSTICSACGTATCSSECHNTYSQKDANCRFIRNFVINNQTSNIQVKCKFTKGLRNIRIKDLVYSMKNDFPAYSPASLSSHKFMKIVTGPSPFTFIVQRGFRQYGQPHETTLDYLEEIEDKNDLYNKFESKLCMCECGNCSTSSPHMIPNCSNQCQNKEILDEKEKLQYGMYRKCYCKCYVCITSYSCLILGSKHLHDDCFGSCTNHNNNNL